MYIYVYIINKTSIQYKTVYMIAQMSRKEYGSQF